MNMGYCKFENTLADFEECESALRNNESLSQNEREAAKQMLLVAASLALDFGLLSLKRDAIDMAAIEAALPRKDLFARELSDNELAGLDEIHADEEREKLEAEIKSRENEEEYL